MIYSPLRGCNNPEVHQIVIKLQGAGTSDPTIAAGRMVESVSRSSAGLHVITLKDPSFSACLAAVATVAEGTPSGLVAEMVTTSNEIYDAANKQVTVQVWNTAGDAAADLGTDDQLSLVLFFQRSTLPVK